MCPVFPAARVQFNRWLGVLLITLCNRRLSSVIIGDISSWSSESTVTVYAEHIVRWLLFYFLSSGSFGSTPLLEALLHFLRRRRQTFLQNILRFVCFIATAVRQMLSRVVWSQKLLHDPFGHINNLVFHVISQRMTGAWPHPPSHSRTELLSPHSSRTQLKARMTPVSNTKPHENSRPTAQQPGVRLLL